MALGIKRLMVFSRSLHNMRVGGMEQKGRDHGKKKNQITSTPTSFHSYLMCPLEKKVPSWLFVLFLLFGLYFWTKKKRPLLQEP